MSCLPYKAVFVVFVSLLLLVVANSILTTITSGWLYVASYVGVVIVVLITGWMLLGAGGPQNG